MSTRTRMTADVAKAFEISPEEARGIVAHLSRFCIDCGRPTSTGRTASQAYENSRCLPCETEKIFTGYHYNGRKFVRLP